MIQQQGAPLVATSWLLDHHQPRLWDKPTSLPLLSSEHLVQLRGRLGLCPRPLSPDRQSHSVPPAPVCTHILQPSDVLLHDLTRIVVERHLTEVCGQERNGPWRKRANFGELVDGVLGHDARRVGWAEAIEGL